MSNRRTVVGAFLHNRWAMLNIRCKNGKYRHLANDKSESYKDTLILFTRDEFKVWCWDRQAIIEALNRPSIDRIDKKKDYSFDNMQIIELAENIRKDKTVFSEFQGKCYSCQGVFELGLFALDKRRSNNRTSICKKCDNKRHTK